MRLMLDESGVIIDDGVVARLAEERFYFTTTTTGSANVYREMQRQNVMWGLECRHRQCDRSVRARSIWPARGHATCWRS